MNMYLNGGRPPGVLEYPGTLTPQQFADIRASWKSVHAGPQNAGNIVVLEGGTKYTPLGLPPADMEYIEQSKFSVEQIARLYGVPSHLIGAMDKPTYASVEQQALEYLQYCLQPIVTNLEKHIASLLLGPGFFYKFNLATFERSDIKSRYGAYAVARQWGWMSVNDIRELEDLNKIGPEGDVYLQPLNMVPATDAAAQLAAQANAEAVAIGNQQGVI
jgi:HK97 family phage portal protein